jgi:cysteine desulfurase
MIYLDHAATTPVFPGALEAAWPWLTSEFGNPSSKHELGGRASTALADARRTVATWLDVSAHEVVFTSGGTEGDNLCVVGLALANPRGKHIVSARTEHEAVLQSIDYLQRIHGFEVTWLAVDETGAIDLAQLDPANEASALRPDTTLVTLMVANNEIGTIHPIAEIAERAHAVGALMHTDAVQAAAWLDIRPTVAGSYTFGVDALTISGHKLGAPKGSGAVYLRAGLAVEPTMHGGGQEDARRSGTENIAWAVALATAIERTVPRGAELTAEAARVSGLTTTFIQEVLAGVPEARLMGARASDPTRLPSIASFVFDGLNGETILLELEERGVVVSSGAACAAGKDEPSHVLRACGFSDDTARTQVRFSLAHTTTADDVADAARATIAATASVRNLRPGANA